jgi:hypothetical protein
MEPWPIPLKDLLHRIEAKTVKTASCWLWQGRCVGTTPMIYVGRKHMAIRRLLWELDHGRIPPGFQASTSCAILHCIRRDHIALKTAREMRIRTGRRLKGQVPQGLASSHTLGPEATQRMWDLWAEGKTYAEIGRQFGVSKGAVQERLLAAGKLPSRVEGKWIDRHRVAHGERNGSAKLTESEVLAIAALRESSLSIPEIITETKIHISQTRVAAILRGGTWGWLTGIPKNSVRSHAVKGERNGRAILTQATVLQAVDLAQRGEKPSAIGATLGIRPALIRALSS